MEESVCVWNAVRIVSADNYSELELQDILYFLSMDTSKWYS